MAGQDWSITISSSKGITTFKANPQLAENTDLISWNNRTNQTHQPWPLSTTSDEPLPAAEVSAALGNYLSDPIPPWTSSQPAYVCTAPTTGSTSIPYCCKFHPSERGEIKVYAS